MTKAEILAVIDTTQIEEISYRTLTGTDYDKRVKYIDLYTYEPKLDKRHNPLRYLYELSSPSLGFFDGVLYYIIFFDRNNMIDDVFRKKYGKPKEKKKTKKEKVYKPYSDRINEWDILKSETVTVTEHTAQWKTGDKDIECKTDYKGSNLVMYVITNTSILKEIEKRDKIVSKIRNESYKNLRETREKKEDLILEVL